MELIVLFVLLCIWVFFGVMGAVFGERKGLKWEGFGLGFVLGPIGWLWVYVMRGNRRNCPACHQLIAPSALICPWCGSQNPHPLPAQPEQPFLGRSPAVVALLLGILAAIIVAVIIACAAAGRGG